MASYRTIAHAALLVLVMLAAGLAPGAEPPAVAQPAGAPVPWVVAFGDMRGELLPCGCSPEGQMGGLPRRETYWNELVRRVAPAAPPVLVDLGNNFAEPSAQGSLKTDVVQGFLGKLPVAAILPGPNELQIGYAVLDRGLPYVVTNNDVPDSFAASKTVTREGERLLIVGYLSPDLVYQGSQDRFRLVPLTPALLRRYEALARRERAQRTLLLFRGSDAELARLKESRLFTAIVAGNPSAEELTAKTERRVGGSAVPQVPTKGQGAIVLTLDGHTAPRVEKLTEAYADGPQATAALKVYDDRVKALFFQEMTAREARAKDSPYLGAEGCKVCHLVEHAVWQGSPHPHALQGLEKVGKNFDPECLECHVVGFSRSGFVSAESTAHLASVQCENCHGPSKLHAANPAVKPVPVGVDGAKPGEGTCRTCHRGAHSPKFAFAQFWPRIQHGPPAAQR